MENSYNFSNFVKLLVDEVCTKETTDLSIYFATLFSSFLYEKNHLDMIAKRFGKLAIIRPILFIENAYSGKSEDLEKAIEAANAVIDTSSSNLIRMEMLLHKLHAEMVGYPKFLNVDATLLEIETMIDEHRELEFYKVQVYYLLRYKSDRDGDMDESMRLLSMATQTAEKLDDPYWKSRVYRQHAEHEEAYDLKKSAEYLQKSREILEHLGDTNGIIADLQEQCRIMAIRGEYDQAIESSHELVTLIQKHGRPVSVASLVLSTLYNVVGNPQAGLEWAKLAEIDLIPIHKPRASLNKAWSLALMGEIDAAFEIINNNREKILKSGLESHLAGLYLINGIAESAIGNYSESLSSIQNALEIYEKRDTLMSVFISLAQLARINLEWAMSEGTGELGPWIDILEEKGRELDCHGIIAQALGLKVRWLIHQNQMKEAEDVMSSFQSLVTEYDLAYLERDLKGLS